MRPSSRRSKNYGNHRAFGLKPGDVAWFYTGHGSWDYPRKVTITGDCNDPIGSGYAAEFLVPEKNDTYKEIHTCNGYLTTSKSQVRKEFHRSIMKAMETTEKNIATGRQNLRWMRWVLDGNGF